MAFKTNVVKTNWEVVAQEKGSYRRSTYLISAESEEKAKMQIPEGFEVVSVKRLVEGGDTDE